MTVVLQAIITKGVAGILLIQVSFALAEFSLQRSRSSRIGRFDTHIKDSVLAGHVISKSQVPSRMDCAFNCLSDQRCVSYNYEEGDMVLHVCELNSECKESKPSNLAGKAGYSYYGTGRNVPSGCLSSPCMNNGTCEDSCIEETSYKCVCIDGRMGDKCQNWTSTAQDYDVLFSNESTTDYIESEINEVLQQFTLCFWMKRISSGWATFFSHMTPESVRNLALRCSEEMDRCHLILINDTRSLDMVPVNDNLWHHICVSWENVGGRWDVLVDGAPRAHGSAWSQTVSLSPGKVVVGQAQEIYGGGFILKESFTGKIGSFNIWDTKMANSEIKEKAKSCSQELGNVIDWRMFRHGIHGNPELISPQSCVSHVAASGYIFDFPSRNVSSYVETATLPTLKKFTLSFWMKQGYNGLLSTGIISYATTEQVKSLTLALGSSAAAINLRIMDSSLNRILYLQPPIVGDIWHHMCITWNNADGKTQLFLDGVLEYAGSGYKVNVTIPGGGIMRIGQHQRSLGGDHHPNFSYRGKFAKMNMWSTVLGDSAIVALLRSPGAENGDVMSWKDMRTAITGNVIVQDVANMQLTAQESDFDLVFPAKSTANYAEYNSMPSLTVFTVCLWIRMSYNLNEHHFFSYSTTTGYEDISMGYYPGNLNLYFSVNSAAWQYYILSSALHDSAWHHLCLTWKSSNGKTCWFTEGKKLGCITDFQTGQTIKGNGKFILGQETDSYGGWFSASQAFYGRMSRLNVWSFVVSETVIEQMAKGCGLWTGDAVAWYNFKNKIFGNIAVITPSSCSLAVTTLQAKRDAYCQSRYSSAQCGTTSRALFDRKPAQVGKIWRCFYDAALTQDSHSNLYVYDTEKNLVCLHSIEGDLLAIIE